MSDNESKGFMGLLDKADKVLDAMDSALPDVPESEHSERRPEPKRVIDVPQPRVKSLPQLRANLMHLAATLEGDNRQEFRLMISEVYAACFASKELTRGG